MTEISENVYWQKFLEENDKNSFSLIYNKYVKDLYAYGISLQFDTDTCMDAVQDIFFKLYLRKNEFDHISNIRFYLFRSFRNRLFDIQKKQKKTQPFEPDPNKFPIEVSVSKQIEYEEERTLLKKKVEVLLQKLTDRQREAIYLRYMQNLEYDEIAEMMKMNSESVRKLVYRGLEAIRKKTQLTPFALFVLLTKIFP
ncbi:MAG TPA: RNA polymerase subunit sigma-70 [Chryseobacterium sp.]|nr:RNA polymerase subunit sigma-70 [Chryseobacterium sp.]